MAFSGKIAVVSGGSGNVGSALVQNLLDAGATVVAPLRSEAAKATLMADVVGSPTEGLRVPILEVSTDDGSARLQEYLREEHGHVDYVVSAIGAWWQKGPLLEQSLEEMQNQVRNLALSHAQLAKATIPVLRDVSDSGYIVITGGAGEGYLVPGTSLTTIGSAALFGVSMALRAELNDRAFRVNEVRLYARVVRADQVEAESAAIGGTAFSSALFAQRVVQVLTDTDKKGEVVRVTSTDLQQISKAA